MSSTQPAESKFMEVGRSVNDIIADLSKPIPANLLSQRKQGKTDITYISWYNATRLLDTYAPGWGYMIELHHIAGKVAAIATISIISAEGIITRQATGYEDEDKEGFGDPFSNSESMALRRAAAKFGLGRYLYDKEHTRSAPVRPTAEQMVSQVAKPMPHEPTPEGDRDEHQELDDRIRQTYVRKGFQIAQLRPMINQRYEVEDGLNSLSLPLKRELLEKLLRP